MNIDERMQRVLADTSLSAMARKLICDLYNETVRQRNNITAIHEAQRVADAAMARAMFAPLRH